MRLRKYCLLALVLILLLCSALIVGIYIALGGFRREENFQKLLVRSRFPEIAYIPAEKFGNFLSMNEIEWSPDSQSIAVADFAVYLYRLDNHQISYFSAPLSSFTSGMSWNSEGTKLVGASAQVAIWDIDSPTEPEAIILPPSQYREYVDVVWGADNIIVVVSHGLNLDDRTIWVWDYDVGRLLWQIHDDDALNLRDGTGGFSAVALAPDGNSLVTTSLRDNRIRVRETKIGMTRFVLEGHSDSVSSVAISPDGTMLASASYGDQTVILWNLDDGQMTQKLDLGHPITAIDWHINGSLLAIASSDGLRLWNLTTGELELIQNISINDVQWSPASDMLAAVEAQGIRIWDTSQISN